MNGNVFIDTNILIYAHTDLNPVKQAKAQKIILTSEYTFISTQVIQEVANILTKKFNHGWKEVEKVIDDLSVNSTVHTNTTSTIKLACQLADRYKFSFYDCLVISAALECNCGILFTEDLSEGQSIEKTLKIVNPFSIG